MREDLFAIVLDRPLLDPATGIVDEDVEIAKRGDGGIYGGAALLEVEHVELQRQGAAALGFDLGGQSGIGGRVAQAQGHIGAGLGKRQGNSAAEAAGCAGDERCAAGEIEACGHFTSSQLPDFSERKIASSTRI